MLCFFVMSWSKVHPSFPHRASGRAGGQPGWICIHEVNPWENVSLGCIVSHIRSHLENHSSTSLSSTSPVPSTHSSSRVQTHAHKYLNRRPHSSPDWVIVPLQTNFTHKHTLFLFYLQHTNIHTVFFLGHVKQLSNNELWAVHDPFHLLSAAEVKAPDVKKWPWDIVTMSKYCQL